MTARHAARDPPGLHHAAAHRHGRGRPPAAWTFVHIWRVADGRIVEHWACRDDMGLLEQLR